MIMKSRIRRGTKTTQKYKIGRYRAMSVHIPGYNPSSDIGLGDAIKNVTRRIGISPCKGCKRRAIALNKRMILVRKRMI